MDLNKVNTYIQRITETLEELKREISVNPAVNIRVNGPAKIKVGDQEITYAPERDPVPDLPFDPIPLIDLPTWPEAVPLDLLCPVDQESEKVARAEAILDMTIETDLRDLRFLDFGCGEGHMAAHAVQRDVLLSVGFDPFGKLPTSREARLRYTNNHAHLEPGGFDVILLYDVLDHAQDPNEVLHHVARLLAPGGVVYAVCHPWTARHGGHLYRQLNKAYAHMWLDEDHLIGRGIRQEFIQRILKPIPTYRQWFVTAGLEITSEKVVESDAPLEQFFRQPDIWGRLTRHYDHNWLTRSNRNEDEIQKIMEIEFVNYTLKKEAIF